MSIQKGVNDRCPISGCTGGSRDKFQMYRHFCLRRSEVKLLIEEDGEMKNKTQPLWDVYKNMNIHQGTKTRSIGNGRRNNEILQNKQEK